MISPLMQPGRRVLAQVIFGGAALAISARADGFGPISVHGSLSAMAAYSDRYGYLGDTARRADIAVTELTVNGNYRFENGVRIGAQIYAYELADYNDVSLDFASVDYSFSERIGVRVGRNKHAFGLYGDVQDVDMLRPFALLPLDFYDKRTRPNSAAIDGVSLYGNIPVGAGSVDYQLDAGWIPQPDAAAPYFRDVSSSSPIDINAFSAMPILNAHAIWNTPIEGLRFGGTIVSLNDFSFRGRMRTAAELSLTLSDARLLPWALPAGMWDAAVAGQTGRADIDYLAWYLSAEYTRGDWQFSVEGMQTDVEQVATMPVLGSAASTAQSESYYAMVTWQAAPRLGLGTYYGIAHGDRHDRDGSALLSVPGHTTWLKDFAVAASYQLADWWLVKAEVHALDGTKGVPAIGNGDAATWKPRWSYFALKSTISF